MEVDRFRDTNTGEERIVLNVSKIRERMRKCKEKQRDSECRRELEEIGIEFI